MSDLTIAPFEKPGIQLVETLVSRRTRSWILAAALAALEQGWKFRLVEVLRRSLILVVVRSEHGWKFLLVEALVCRWSSIRAVVLSELARGAPFLWMLSSPLVAVPFDQV